MDGDRDRDGMGTWMETWMRCGWDVDGDEDMDGMGCGWGGGHGWDVWGRMGTWTGVWMGWDMDRMRTRM